MNFAAELDPCYEALGFTRPPFSISPDTSLFFPNGQHVAAFNGLHAAMSAGQIAVLTGEVGLGKTLICRCLLRRPPPNTQIAVVSNPLQDYEGIMRLVHKEFTGSAPWPAAQAGHVQEQITEFALSRATVGDRLVILVDEAQKLSAEALEGLRLLTNVETERHRLISLVLVGQPELERTLALRAMRPLRERIGLWHRLTPMTREECNRYVRHRIQVAAGGQSITFSGAALLAVYQHSKGVPRRVNLLCDRALLLAYATEQSTVGWTTVRRARRELLPEVDA